MEDRCTALINEILFENHTQIEWNKLHQRFHDIVSTATKEEKALLEESGVGEILYMICS